MNRSRAPRGLAIKSVRPSRWASLALVLTVCLATLLAGCSPDLVAPVPPQDEDSGTLVIEIGSAAASQILLPPIDMRPASYRIRGSGPDGSTFTLDTTQTQTEKTDLTPGSWTVTVEALNAGAQLIGRGQAVVELSAGAARTVSITITPVQGSGTLQLTVRWPQASVPSAAVNARLVPSGGTAIPLSFTMGSGTATSTRAGVPTGYYSLEVKLMSGATEVMGAVEAVRIVDGQTTTGTFDFAAAENGDLQVTVTPRLADPLTVTLSGTQAQLTAGSTMTVSASVPAGTGSVTYAWYLNGRASGTAASCTVGSGLSAGTYRLDVNVFSADGTRAGSATHTFEVTGVTPPPPPPPVSATLAWDANTEADLAGYRLYYGNAAGSYPNRIEVGNRTTCTVDGLDPAKSWRFVVTAYNASGQESTHSNEIVLAAR